MENQKILMDGNNPPKKTKVPPPLSLSFSGRYYQLYPNKLYEDYQNALGSKNQDEIKKFHSLVREIWQCLTILHNPRSEADMRHHVGRQVLIDSSMALYIFKEPTLRMLLEQKDIEDALKKAASTSNQEMCELSDETLALTIIKEYQDLSQKTLNAILKQIFPFSAKNFFFNDTIVLECLHRLTKDQCYEEDIKHLQYIKQYFETNEGTLLEKSEVICKAISKLIP